MSLSDLPDELLLCIFTLSVGYYLPKSESFKHAPFPRMNVRAASPLMLVCKRWCAVISQHASFWANIDIRNFRQVPTLLERSRKSPLHIDWEDSNLVCLRHKSEGQQAFTDILSHFPRIRHLNLSVDSGTFKKAESFLATNSPVLQSLRVQGWSFVHSQTLRLHHGSRLQLLILRNTVIPDLSVCTFPELRVLDIAFAPTSSESQLEAILICLSRTPLLRRLVVQSHTKKVPGYSTDLCHTANLPHLLEFVCRADYGDSLLLRLARHLTFPPHCSFIFKADISLPGSALVDWSSSWLSIPRDQIMPWKLHLADDPKWDRRVYQIWCDEASGLNTLIWKVPYRRYSLAYPITDHTPNILREQHTMWCNVAHVNHLICELSLSCIGWNVLLDRCKRLRKISLDLYAAYSFGIFLEEFDRPSWARRDSRLPAKLTAIEVEERVPAYTTPSRYWMEVIKRFSETLAKRRKTGFIVDEFTIIRTVVQDASKPDEPAQCEWEWEGSEKDLADLRAVVNKLEVTESIVTESASEEDVYDAFNVGSIDRIEGLLGCGGHPENDKLEQQQSPTSNLSF